MNPNKCTGYIGIYQRKYALDKMTFFSNIYAMDKIRFVKWAYLQNKVGNAHVNNCKSYLYYMCVTYELYTLWTMKLSHDHGEVTP
jgi:hypothetical protein